MVTPFLFGSTIVFFGEKMLESDFRVPWHLLSFSSVRISLTMLNGIGKDTPINRGNTPKHMLYSLVLCHAILSIERKGGVCH